MARNRRMSEAEQAGAEPITLVPMDPDNEPMDGGDASQQWAEFEKFRDEAETGSAGKRIWVYRIPTDPVGNPVSGVESALLFDAPLDTYTLSEVFARVKREYMARGLGRCLIRIQVRQEKTRGVLWQKVIPIEKGTRDDDGAAPSIGAAGSDPAIAALAQAMQQQNQLLARIFESQRAAPAQLPPADPFGGAEKIVAMVTGLAGVLAKPSGGGAGIGGSVGEIREILKLAQDLGNMKGGATIDADPADPDSITEIMKVGAPYVGLLKSLIERSPAPNPMQPTVQRRLPPTAAPALQPEPQRAAPVQSTAAPPAAPGQSAQGEREMLLTLKKHLGDICTLVEQGSADPDGIALLILDAVPAEQDDRFYEIVADDNYMMKLAAVEPRVKNHAEFFAAIRARLLQEFENEAQAEVLPGGAE